MPIPWKIGALGLLVAAAPGCREQPPTPPAFGEVLPNLPLPPMATVVSREGSDQALAITFSSPLAADSMADYYRVTLTSGEWTLVSDTRGADGGYAMYAERDGPPLWVQIRTDSATRNTLVTLAGARSRPDSAAAATP